MDAQHASNLQLEVLHQQLRHLASVTLDMPMALVQQPISAGKLK